MKKIIRETLKKERLIDYASKNLQPPYIRNLMNMGLTGSAQKVLSKIFGFRVWVEDNTEWDEETGKYTIPTVWDVWSEKYEDTNPIIYTEWVGRKPYKEVHYRFHVEPNDNLNESDDYNLNLPNTDKKQLKLYNILKERFLNGLNFYVDGEKLYVDLPSDFILKITREKYPNEPHPEDRWGVNQVESWDYHLFPREKDPFDKDFINYFNEYGLTDMELLKLMYRRFTEFVADKNEKFYNKEFLNESTISDVKEELYERLLDNLLSQTKFISKSKYNNVYIKFPFSDAPHSIDFIENLKRNWKLLWNFLDFMKKNYPNVYDESKLRTIWKTYMDEIEDIWVNEYETNKDKKLMDYITNFLISNTEVDFDTGWIIQNFWETIDIKPQYKVIKDYLFRSDIHLPVAIFDLFERFGLEDNAKGYYVWDMYRKKLKDIVLRHGY